MSFYNRDEEGNIIRKRVVTDCSESEDNPLITEQSHKAECDINAIIKKHGVDMIQRTSRLMQENMRFDDVTGNDFQEAMEKVTKAKTEFLKLPSAIRDRFDNNPAKFLDFAHNPDNLDEMNKMGLIKVTPQAQAPVQVQVMNPETPAADSQE